MGLAVLLAPIDGLAQQQSLLRTLEGLQAQVFIENDSFSGTDRYYTNGLKIGAGVSEQALPGPIRERYRRLLRAVGPARPGETEPERQLHFGLFIGQNMYTPRDIRIRAPQPFDRPWAGWSYLGLVGQRLSGPSDTLDTLEIDLGVVGPASGAKAVQTWWHDVVGAPQPEGWANQLPNEPAFLVAYLRKRRHGDGRLDVIPHAGLTLGTVSTLARAGGIVRYGRNMTGFGPDVVDPGGAMLHSARRQSQEERPRASSREWYGFAGFDARLVAHNIFLDGTVFRDSPAVDRRRFVYDVLDVLVGASARIDWFRVSVTRVMRSEEFATPLGGGGRQHFHSVNVSFEF
jgi:hypothetical protein